MRPQNITKTLLTKHTRVGSLRIKFNCGHAAPSYSPAHLKNLGRVSRRTKDHLACEINHPYVKDACILNHPYLKKCLPLKTTEPISILLNKAVQAAETTNHASYQAALSEIRDGIKRLIHFRGDHLTFTTDAIKGGHFQAGLTHIFRNRRGFKSLTLKQDSSSAYDAQEILENVPLDFFQNPVLPQAKTLVSQIFEN